MLYFKKSKHEICNANTLNADESWDNWVLSNCYKDNVRFLLCSHMFDCISHMYDTTWGSLVSRKGDEKISVHLKWETYPQQVTSQGCMCTQIMASWTRVFVSIFHCRMCDRRYNPCPQRTYNHLLGHNLYNCLYKKFFKFARVHYEAALKY